MKSKSRLTIRPRSNCRRLRDLSVDCQRCNSRKRQTIHPNYHRLDDEPVDLAPLCALRKIGVVNGRDGSKAVFGPQCPDVRFGPISNQSAVIAAGRRRANSRHRVGLAVSG